MDLKIAKYKDIAILPIVPIILALLILTSFSLAHWKIGPYFINATLAIVATIFGGFQRFISGFKDLFKLKITINVFVVVALIATMVIGEFRPAAIIVFIMAVAGAFESYVLDRTKKTYAIYLILPLKWQSFAKTKKSLLFRFLSLW